MSMIFFLFKKRFETDMIRLTDVVTNVVVNQEPYLVQGGMKVCEFILGVDIASFILSGLV